MAPRTIIYFSNDSLIANDHVGIPYNATYEDVHKLVDAQPFDMDNQDMVATYDCTTLNLGHGCNGLDCNLCGLRNTDTLKKWLMQMQEEIDIRYEPL